MAVTLNASTSTGLVQSADNSGIIEFQSNGVTKATLNSSGFSYPGAVLQVVSATATTQVSSSNNTYVDTNLTATITPKFATSKVLVFVNQCGLRKTVASSENSLGLKLLRGSTVIAIIAVDSFYSGTALGLNGQSLSTCYSDSPATTSATTYKTQFACNSGTGSVVCQQDSTVSTITLMEIAV